MKLRTKLLEKMIELPPGGPEELRHLLDDVGLEVKDVESTAGGDTVFNIETLANRGDHLSVLGAARELSARLLTALKTPPMVESFDDRRASVVVRIETERCSRYALLELSLPHGMELRADVRAFSDAAAKTHHAIVDLLNYVQLEIGQPMHAFDHAKVEGEIAVRESTEAHEIEALDGRTYSVPAGSILICDRKKIIAVAGVIGCANSMVGDATTRVLVESAHFDPVSVRKTARAMGLSTEASYAFERGADPENVLRGLRRLAYLVSSSGGTGRERESAQVLGATIVERSPVERRVISLDPASVRREMHLPRLSEIEIATRLKHLGYRIDQENGGKLFRVTVPSWRLFDVHSDQDLVEDFVRSHGLNKVKVELPPLTYDLPDDDPVEALRRRLEPVLHGNGFVEVITKSLYSRDEVSLVELLDPALAREHVVVKNAVERAYSNPRITNVINLARLCERNRRHGVVSCKVYELGRLFRRGDTKGSPFEFEWDALTLAVSGRWNEHEWRKPETLEELLALAKGTIESMFWTLGVSAETVACDAALLHPGYRAAVRVKRTECGWFGVVHPELQNALEVRAPVIYAEFDVQRLCRIAEEERYGAAVDYPAVRRDLTLRIGARQPAGDVTRLIQEQRPPDLRSCEIIDSFTREGESFRRVTYRLVFQSPERTLSSADVDAAVAALVTTLAAKEFELAD